LQLLDAASVGPYKGGRLASILKRKMWVNLTDSPRLGTALTLAAESSVHCNERAVRARLAHLLVIELAHDMSWDCEDTPPRAVR